MQHLRGEDVTQRRSPGHDAHVAVVQPIDEHHEPQRHRLVADGVHASPDGQLDTCDERAVAARMQRGQMGKKRVEIITRDGGSGAFSLDELPFSGRAGGRRRPAMPKVRTVDPDDVEVCRQPLNLPEKVSCGKTFLAQTVREGVGRSGQHDARLGESLQQRRHQHGVAGIIELELVDADQSVTGQPVDGVRETEGADQVCQLDECPKELRPRGRVPQRRKEVGLTNPESPVEVDPRPAFRRCRRSTPPRTFGSRCSDARGEDLKGSNGRSLGGLLRVRLVGGERLARKERRGHQSGHQVVSTHLRHSVHEPQNRLGGRRRLGRHRGEDRRVQERHRAWAKHNTAVLCHDQGVRRLLPTPGHEISLPADVDDLAAHYAYPAAGALRANMVGSVDGAISLDGRSKPISGRTDWFLFGLQRALADAVVVGAGTARSEGYGPGRARPEFAHLRTAASQASAPTLALVTASGKLDPAAAFFGGSVRSIVITSASADEVHIAPLREVADIVVAGEASVDLAAALDLLRQRGLARVLTEGGPSLLGALAAEDLIDEVVATISPILVGGDSGRMVAGAPAAVRNLELVGLLEDDSALFTHYRRPRGDTS